MLGNFRLEVMKMQQSATGEVESRRQSMRMMTLVIGVLSLLAAVGLLFIFLLEPSWQLGSLSVLYTATGLYGIIALRVLFPQQRYMLGQAGLSMFLALAILATAAFLKGVGIPVAIVYLIVTLVVSSSTLEDMQANFAIAFGILISGAAALAGEYSPLPQLSVELIEVLTPAILGVLFMVYVVMLAMQFVTATLRIRLVTAFIAIVIIPLTILSAIQGRFTFTALTAEVNNSLQLASQQAAVGVSQFIQERQNIIKNAAGIPAFRDYLTVPPGRRAGSDEEDLMRVTLKVLDAREAASTVYLSSFALLDENGINQYDTLLDRLETQFKPEVIRSLGVDLKSYTLTGEDESAEDYFRNPMLQKVPYISPVRVVSTTESYFFISVPVFNEQNQVTGVLRARYDARLLQDLLKEYEGLRGPDSHVLLLDENNIRLADTYMPDKVYQALAPLSSDTVRTLKANLRLPGLTDEQLWTNYPQMAQMIEKITEVGTFSTQEMSQEAGLAEYSDLGAVTKIKGTAWKLVYLQTRFSTEALRKQQRQSTTLVTTLISALIAFIAMGMSQILSQPILRLTQTARQISSGDLQATANVESSDEFGTLGRAFNLMTDQLRTLINQLEDRVRARTQEIERQNMALVYRADQLRTVSEVARQIVSSQELETLLPFITRLVSERFGFYHVGIFLVDEAREYAILRAANSEGGQRMLARNHKLAVGRVGIVGYATGTGEPRIATDVGADAVFFNNPDLPNTRSEMALPLKAGDQIIGALDIQSTESNAFDPEDIELFTTLADQVAIAIYNNQLFSETVRALNEAQNLHRQYLRGEWAADASRRKVLGYLYNQSDTTPLQAENPLWKKVFHSGEPVFAMLPNSNGAPSRAMMAVPVAVRGETIGVIHVQDQGDDRMWSEDEIAMVNSIANQVAVALENARLFETTVRRAEREKKVLQITQKIRSTNDPEEMMRIAVQELQQALQATRTQIYIRAEESEEPGSTGSNGHGGPGA